MKEQTSTMLERLEQFLEKNPKDSFLRYGLAMELTKLGRTDEAVANFRQVIEDDPDYVAAYQQAGMTLARTGRRDEAREVLRRGIEAAVRRKESHALSEMEGILAELENF